MEREIVKYNIVQGNSTAEVVQDVSKLINEGWQPYGSLTVVERAQEEDIGGYTFCSYAQAVVIYKPQPDVQLFDSTIGTA